MVVIVVIVMIVMMVMMVMVMMLMLMVMVMKEMLVIDVYTERRVGAGHHPGLDRRGRRGPALVTRAGVLSPRDREAPGETWLMSNVNVNV